MALVNPTQTNGTCKIPRVLKGFLLIWVFAIGLQLADIQFNDAKYVRASRTWISCHIQGDPDYCPEPPLINNDDYKIVTLPEGCEVTLLPMEAAHIPPGCVVSGDTFTSFKKNGPYVWASSDGDDPVRGQILNIQRDDVWVWAKYGAYVYAPGTDAENVRTTMKSPSGGCGIPEGCHDVSIIDLYPDGNISSR